METSFAQILDQVMNYVDPAYLLTFMLLAYAFKRYFLGLAQKLIPGIRMVYIVFILALLVAIPFYFFGVPVRLLLITYAVGTSLHELLFQWIEKRLRP